MVLTAEATMVGPAEFSFYYVTGGGGFIPGQFTQLWEIKTPRSRRRCLKTELSYTAISVKTTDLLDLVRHFGLCRQTMIFYFWQMESRPDCIFTNKPGRVREDMVCGVLRFPSVSFVSLYNLNSRLPYQIYRRSQNTPSSNDAITLHLSLIHI